MKADLHHDRHTDVAYIDVCVNLPSEIRIDVVDVTDQLGLKSQVLARIDEQGRLLGLIIQDYSAFKREVRRKYLALAVERILDLIISKVRELTSHSSDSSEFRRLPAHV
jgi:uncharacterized protein YuzE